MPPTRREQLELDELLSDIYKGIETLPDKSQAQAYAFNSKQTSNHQTSSPYSTSNIKQSHHHKQHQQQVAPTRNNKILHSRSYVKEYELPASSPLVRQHKQELREIGNHTLSNTSASSPSQKQPHRSTLKRQNTPDQRQAQRHQPQSLASFVTSTTPENKRRVRIVDHPDKLAKTRGVNEAYSSEEENFLPDREEAEEDEEAEAERLRDLKRRSRTGADNVKYVNTNKLIYHQEQNPDDERLSDSDENNYNNQGDNHDPDDIDGVTRVEYYHTTWLDRQLGRASKRRSSKELSERQVKEKAMIEELKRNLKNGAITLRQSFRGKNNHNKSAKNSANKGSRETIDDQVLDVPGNRKIKHQNDSSTSKRVFGSGLATVPRNYHQKETVYNNFSSNSSSRAKQQSSLPKSTYSATTLPSSQRTAPKQTVAPASNQFDSVYQPVQAREFTGKPAVVEQTQPQPQQVQQQVDHSRTLPHNYHLNPNQEVRRTGAHQLLQSHYKGGNRNFNTISNTSNLVRTNVNSSQSNSDSMRNPLYGKNNSNYGCANYGTTPAKFGHQHQQQDQPAQLGNTISSIPSATEVVRSALSRSGSQTSLNQLNKTINLLPNSPSPYAPSPMTPTQQLKAASPSLTPSPARSSPYQRQNSDLTSGYNQPGSAHTLCATKNSDRQQHQPVLSGTRTVGRPPQPSAATTPAKQPVSQQQPVYANPHASLMQHRLDQQMRSPNRYNNSTSIREFNELDSLLRSLSPSSTTITPGYNIKPAQPAYGYGFSQPPSHQQVPSNNADLYAKVQKQPAASYRAPTSGGQFNATNLNNNLTNQQPYTIDVTKKDDESLYARKQDLSEFEPPVDLLLPSMEDYQNITKLNPVKNHYWYKPNMSRDRAISLLKDKPQGTFIVRDSTSFRGAYGLAVKVAKLPKNVLNNANLRNPNGDPSSELIRHFLIEPAAGGVRLKGYANESVYGSLPALIYQHSLTELALPCRLVIPRADIEDPQFNYKQKQFYDEFIASKEQARHSPYERTSPNGGYRKYPGDVYVHNEHRIIFE